MSLYALYGSKKLNAMVRISRTMQSLKFPYSSYMAQKIDLCFTLLSENFLHCFSLR